MSLFFFLPLVAQVGKVVKVHITTWIFSKSYSNNFETVFG